MPQLTTVLSAMDRDDNPRRDRAGATALRVLLTLTHPRYRDLPLVEKARKAHLTPNSYLRLIKDLEFQQLLRSSLEAEVASVLPSVLQDVIMSARMPGRDGFNDRKTLLSIGKLLTANSVSRSAHTEVREIGPNLAAALARAEAGRSAIPSGDLAGPILEGRAIAQAQPPASDPDPERPSGPRDLLDSF